MENNSLVTLLILIAVTILTVLFTEWIFSAVMATDWPDWVKYLILH